VKRYRTVNTLGQTVAHTIDATGNIVKTVRDSAGELITAPAHLITKT